MKPSLILTAIGLLAGLAAANPATKVSDSERSSITIYNDNSGLVTETRRLELAKGRQSILFDGVSRHILPSSVLFDCEGTTLLEQNYEYDLVDAQALMQRYLGQTVDVRLEDGEVRRGTLLSGGSEIVLQTEDGVVSLRTSAVKGLQYPELPDGLRLKPALRWELDAARAGSREASISYISGGLNWAADYVCLIDADDRRMEMAGWVSLSNRTGITWKGALLQLVAGTLNRVRPEDKRMPMGRGEMLMMAADAAVGFEEERLFEYHLYTLGRPVDLLDNQDKQVALFQPMPVVLSKDFVVESGRINEGVQVKLRFDNKDKQGPGQPLPAGIVRLYKADSQGRRQLVGEDRIGHIPTGEEVALTLGRAFDLVAERTVIDEKRIGRTVETEVEYALRNRKPAESVEILVREQLWGDWTLLSCDLPSVKKDARTLEVPVQVPAGGEIRFRLRVRR
jgi:hypothetical protein